MLVADDQDLVRTGIRLILGTLDGIEVVGEAADGAEAVRLARELRPDVCLMDIRMPVLDGVEATRQLAGPGVEDPVAVVVITTFDLDEYVHGALRAGATGFLLKDAGPELLGEAIRAAAARRLADLAEHHPAAALDVRRPGSGNAAGAAGRAADRAGGAGAGHGRPRAGPTPRSPASCTSASAP